MTKIQNLIKLLIYFNLLMAINKKRYNVCMQCGELGLGQVKLGPLTPVVQRLYTSPM